MKKNNGYNSNKENEEKEETLEVVISYVLVGGIILSFIIITYGLLLYYIAPPTSSLASHLSPKWQIRTGSDFFTYFAGLLSYFTTTSFVPADPVRIIGLGIVLLIVTPFIRVVASAIFFGYRRNFKYLLITSFVLIVLLFSLTMHK